MLARTTLVLMIEVPCAGAFRLLRVLRRVEADCVVRPVRVHDPAVIARASHRVDKFTCCHQARIVPQNPVWVVGQLPMKILVLMGIEAQLAGNGKQRQCRLRPALADIPLLRQPPRVNRRVTA